MLMSFLASFESWPWLIVAHFQKAVLLGVVFGKVFVCLAAGDGLSRRFSRIAQGCALRAMIVGCVFSVRYKNTIQLGYRALRMAECEREEGGRYLQMESQGEEDWRLNGLQCLSWRHCSFVVFLMIS